MSERETIPGDVLHRLHDGALPPEERARIEARLDDGARLQLAAIDDVGQAVRGAMDSSTAGFDVWAAVEKEIAPAKVLSFRERLARRRPAPVWISTLVAAAAAAAFLLLPARLSALPSNNCDIESLDVTGGSATVMKLDDPHGEGTTTVVWLEEE
jgi:anti-sigma factor RsiW